MRQLIALAMIAFLVAVDCPPLKSQGLDVKNVRVRVRPDEKVLVLYDLHGRASAKYSVRISLYWPEAKKSIRISTKQMLGDVGRDVRAGENRKVLWSPPKRLLSSMKGANIKVKVDAFTQKESRRWPWIVLGIAAVSGGTAAAMSLSAADPPSNEAGENLPAPPDFPGVP